MSSLAWRARRCRRSARLATEDGGDYYNIFDFTRFHVRHNEKTTRSTRASSLSYLKAGTGKTKSRTDKDVCEVEADAVDAATNEGQFDAAIAQLAERCHNTLWGFFRDRGYITVDMAIEAGDLGEYFSLCQKKCADSEYSQRRGKNSSGGQGVGSAASRRTSVPGVERRGQNASCAGEGGHSFQSRGTPVFGTQQPTPTGFRACLSLAPDEGFIKALRASAATRGVPLPLVVLHSDHGSHYGDSQLARAGRIEHKFPLLLVLVPETMLKRTPGLRERLNINRKRLVSAFDLYHTLKRFAGDSKGQKVGTTVASEDEPAAHSK